MKHGTHAIVISALGLFGCGVLQVNGKPSSLGAGLEPEATTSSGSGETGATKQNKKEARGPYVPPPEKKQYLADCGAKIEESRQLWSEQEKKTRAAVEASDKADIYEGWLGLMNQYRDNCVASKKLGNRLYEPVRRSTAIELTLAVARFQVRHDMVIRTPLRTGNQGEDAVNWVPMGDDKTFNAAESCRSLGSDIAYLTTDEFNTWKATHDPRIKEQKEVIDVLFKAFNAAHEKTSGEYGRIKKLQKLPDGLVKLSMGNLYGGSECVHLGDWRFNGTSWTDCDYKAAPEKEIYQFTVTFAPARIPRGGLQVGDVLLLWGIRTKAGSDIKHPEENAEYDGALITNQFRGTKRLLELPSLDTPMNCVRID